MAFVDMGVAALSCPQTYVLQHFPNPPTDVYILSDPPSEIFPESWT